METKMKLSWECKKCGKEQTTYLAEADWHFNYDRCGDITGVYLCPICVYCKSEDTHEEIT